MQEEVTQKTIAFSIKSAKLTIQVLQAAARKFLETQNKGKTKLHHGQQSLKQLKKHGAALSNIEITDANIGLFKPCAKKYGVDFTLRKDATTQPPHYIVIFKAKDADNMEQAFKEFTAKKLQREERPSIRKDIAASKERQQPATLTGPRKNSKKGGCHDEAGNEKTDNRQSALSAVCLSVRQAGAGVPAGGGHRPFPKAPALCGWLRGGL